MQQVLEFYFGKLTFVDICLLIWISDNYVLVLFMQLIKFSMQQNDKYFTYLEFIFVELACVVVVLGLVMIT